MRWDEADARDSAVVQGGTWCSTMDVYFFFPRRTGVFLFADEHLDVKYVSGATSGRLALAARQAFVHGQGDGATRALWLVTDRDASALELARRLERKYLPPVRQPRAAPLRSVAGRIA